MTRFALGFLLLSLCLGTGQRLKHQGLSLERFHASEQADHETLGGQAGLSSQPFTLLGIELLLGCGHTVIKATDLVGIRRGQKAARRSRTG